MSYTLLQFYTDILSDLNITCDNAESMLSVATAAGMSPVNINGKRLCLPEKSYLKDGDFKKTIGFHPLSENIMYGESIVLKSLKSYIEYSINERIAMLLTEMVSIASDPAARKKLGAKGAALFKALPEVDATFADAVRKIIGKVGSTNGEKFVNIFLTHGSFGGVEGTRTAIVTYPVFDEENLKGSVFGVKLRKGDIAPWNALISLILGDPAKAPKEMSYGSFAKVAPFLHALLNTFKNLAEKINSHVKIYAKQMESPEDLTYQLKWVEGLEMFDDWIGDIPALSGNTGADDRVDPRVKSTWDDENKPLTKEVADDAPQSRYLRRSERSSDVRRTERSERDVERSDNPVRAYLDRKDDGRRSYLTGRSERSGPTRGREDRNERGRSSRGGSRRGRGLSI